MKKIKRAKVQSAKEVKLNKKNWKMLSYLHKKIQTVSL